MLDLIENNPFRTPLLFNQRAPGQLDEAKVEVPVFLTGQYQDEQTGGNFPTALSSLNGKPDVWITMQNGVHTDSIGPSNITRWVEFLEIFVADEVPGDPGSVRRAQQSVHGIARRTQSTRSSSREYVGPCHRVGGQAGLPPGQPARPAC